MLFRPLVVITFSLTACVPAQPITFRSPTVYSSPTVSAPAREPLWRSECDVNIMTDMRYCSITPKPGSGIKALFLIADTGERGLWIGYDNCPYERVGLRLGTDEPRWQIENDQSWPWDSTISRWRETGEATIAFTDWPYCTEERVVMPFDNFDEVLTAAERHVGLRTD